MLTVHGHTLPLILAPMVGVTDAPMRALCRQFGADLCYGEMTAAREDDERQDKFQRRRHVANEPRPRIVQLAGAESKILADGAQRSVTLGADVIDINMGCPAKKVRKKACGSALMADPGLVREIFAATTAAVDVPVSVKIRTGPNRGQRNALQIAQLAQDAGLAAVAIHGRTRADMYKGEAEYATIAQVKRELDIPVIANGDIDSPAKALRVLELTRADALMMGRAALGQPWLFGQIRAALDARPPLAPPEADELIPLICDHALRVDEHYGSRLGLKVFRKHLAAWLQHLNLAAETRVRLLRAGSREESLDLLRQLAMPMAA